MISAAIFSNRGGSWDEDTLGFLGTYTIPFFCPAAWLARGMWMVQRIEPTKVWDAGYDLYYAIDDGTERVLEDINVVKTNKHLPGESLDEYFVTSADINAWLDKEGIARHINGDIGQLAVFHMQDGPRMMIAVVLERPVTPEDF